MKDLVAQFEGIAYVIYNKNANITIDLNGGSIDLEDCGENKNNYYDIGVYTY